MRGRGRQVAPALLTWRPSRPLMHQTPSRQSLAPALLGRRRRAAGCPVRCSTRQVAPAPLTWRPPHLLPSLLSALRPPLPPPPAPSAQPLRWSPSPSRRQGGRVGFSLAAHGTRQVAPALLMWRAPRLLTHTLPALPPLLPPQRLTAGRTRRR